ncbi:taste receptor type 2 member 13-like [Eleutherodactylus coqui]|uniref:taste receptor type 2 member 13-like n=1 Tax=Eleutherodactylus coqui TaxID=57060 RepID=UPI003462C396
MGSSLGIGATSRACPGQGIGTTSSTGPDVCWGADSKSPSSKTRKDQIGGYHILILAVGLSFLAGFLINVFIVAVNISEWRKGRMISTADKVITSLGISRMVFQVTCLLNVFCDIYFYRLSVLFFASVLFFELSSVYSSIWLSTLLSVIFFLKISTLHNPFFLRLKILVLNRVLLLIVASIVVSISFAFAYDWMNTFKIPHNSTQETYLNGYTGLRVLTLIFWCTGPLLTYFISSILLIICLYNHVSRMRSGRNRTSHLDTYYKTIKFTGFSLFSSTVYMIIDLTYTYWYDAFGLLGVYFIWQIFPTLHSIYLISVTTKLRIQVSNMVHMLRRQGGDPKAPVETVFQ